MPSLAHLDLSWNLLSGCIELARAPSLMRLKLMHTTLTCFTTGLGAAEEGFPQLTDFEASDSTFTEFPPLHLMSALTSLDLHNNSITGTLPPSLGKLSSVVFLDLSYNHLYGPVNIYQITKLKTLFLANNQFDSFSPLFNPIGLQDLDLSNNLLSGTMPYIDLSRMQR